MPLDANRFHIITEELTFDEAKSKCESMGAKLFEPKSIHENEFVKDLTKNYGAIEYWIGILGHQVYSSDDTPITWSHFSPLAKNENPTECGNGKKCTAVCFNCQNEMAMWKDECCSLKLHSVCDKQLGKPSFYILLSY